MSTKTSRKEYWLDHLSKFQQSKLSQTDYCKQQSLNYTSFNHWKRRLEKERNHDFVEISSRLSSPCNEETTVVITVKNSVFVSVPLAAFSRVFKEILNVDGIL